MNLRPKKGHFPPLSRSGVSCARCGRSTVLGRYVPLPCGLRQRWICNDCGERQ